MDRRKFISDGDACERTLDDATPTRAVVETVAEARGCGPTDLPPLNEVVDPDALDRLFADARSGRPRRGGHLVFHYAGCTVTVLGTGRVVVRADG